MNTFQYSRRKKIRNLMIVVTYGLLFFIFLLLYSALLTLSIIFPGREIKSGELVGYYTGRYEVFPKITTRYRKGIFEGGTHSLELKPDGTYIYIYSPIDGNDVKTIGTWEFSNKYGPQVVLSGFSISPSSNSKGKPGYVYLRVSRTRFGSICIRIHADFEYYWIQQKKTVKVEKKMDKIRSDGPV